MSPWEALHRRVWLTDACLAGLLLSTAGLADPAKPQAMTTPDARHPVERPAQPSDDLLKQPWPKQRQRTVEVGRYDVRWRDRVSKAEGLFVGVRFDVPLERQRVWELANDYGELGKETPGVTAVRIVERAEHRQLVQLDVSVLWKRLRLNVEVEQDPPHAIRFRLLNQALGASRGLCTFEEQRQPGVGGEAKASTTVELMTWLKPSRPVPLGLLLFVERGMLLSGVRAFLDSCEPPRPRRPSR